MEHDEQRTILRPWLTRNSRTYEFGKGKNRTHGMFVTAPVSITWIITNLS